MLDFEKNPFPFIYINLIMYIAKKGKEMKKILIGVITTVFFWNVLILPPHCPMHYKVDDCWKIQEYYGANHGHK